MRSHKKTNYSWNYFIAAKNNERAKCMLCFQDITFVNVASSNHLNRHLKRNRPSISFARTDNHSLCYGSGIFNLVPVIPSSPIFGGNPVQWSVPIRNIKTVHTNPGLLKNYTFNQSYYTRHRSMFQLSVHNLKKLEKRSFYMGLNVYNKLSNSLKCLPVRKYLYPTWKKF